ncbi:RNA polymerase sigma factor [Hymenobacter jejuensis]|nr:sigma-70 family RNA polymerase sigma factor [Hymenobacter jejuensis]
MQLVPMKSFDTAALPAADSAAQLRQALLADRERTLTRLYQRTFPMVRRYVLRNGGTVHDAQDVFQDALVIFYEKAVGGTLVLTASASTYLVSVCRNLWRRELSRRSHTPQCELTETDLLEDAEPTASETESETALSVLEYVEQLGEKCKSILLSFYYFQQPLHQIAETHHYRSVRSATVQKFKCLERLRKSVRAVLAETLIY